LSQNQDQAALKLVLGAKIIHILLFTLIVIAAVILLLLRFQGYVPMFSGDTPGFWIVDVVPVLLTVLALLFGYFFPNMKWTPSIWNNAYLFKYPSTPDLAVFWIYMVRSIFFMAVPIWTFLFGLLGSSLYIWLPILIVSGFVAVITFPTKKQWNVWRTYIHV
jgi:hypothetical protein